MRVKQNLIYLKNQWEKYEKPLKNIIYNFTLYYILYLNYYFFLFIKGFNIYGH